jgi:hypothetical protein
MTTNDRAPVILALLADLVRERSLAAPNEADLHHLSDGLALAVDHCAAALMWALGDVDEHNLVIDLGKIITGEMEAFVGPDKRRVLGAIARRLADVAASLLVRGYVHRAEAGALWSAAERLLGLQDETPERADQERLQVHVDLATAMAQRDPQMTYVATAGGVVVENNRTVDLRDQTIRDMRADLASMTEQRNILKRQLEELRTETRAPVLSQLRIAESGGPIWVRVADTSSKHFGIVGRLEGVEFASKDGEEMWSVDLGGIANVRWQASLFVVVGAGRVSQPPSNSTPAEPNPDNRDSYRGTVLRAGAKDCALFIGPAPRDLTFVVEMREGSKVFDVVAALEHHHGLAPESYRIREVRTTTTD